MFSPKKKKETMDSHSEVTTDVVRFSTPAFGPMSRHFLVIA